MNSFFLFSIYSVSFLLDDLKIFAKFYQTMGENSISSREHTLRLKTKRRTKRKIWVFSHFSYNKKNTCI